MEIEITSYYFRGSHSGFESFPARMVMDGREYNFLESGMRYLVGRGQRLIRLFDVSDGQTEFRLRLDGSNHWTLVNMRGTF